jgi:hypothetical protein
MPAETPPTPASSAQSSSSPSPPKNKVQKRVTFLDAQNMTAKTPHQPRKSPHRHHKTPHQNTHPAQKPLQKRHITTKQKKSGPATAEPPTFLKPSYTEA